MRVPRRWLATLALLTGLGLMTVFGAMGWRQWQFAQRVARGEIQVETLRGWMTLPYIARVHGVPEAELRAALALPAQGHAERSLREWFEAEGIEPVTGRRRIEVLIVARHRPPGEPAR